MVQVMPNKPDELDELHELLIKKLNTKKRMIEPHDERFVIGFQTEAPGDDVDWQYLDEVIMRFVNHFIRTEKLKLLAEVKSEWGKFGKGTNISDGEYAFLDIIEKLRSEL